MSNSSPIYVRRSPLNGSRFSQITGAGVKAQFGYRAVVWFKTDDGLKGLEINGDPRILKRLFLSLAERLHVPDPESQAPDRKRRVQPDARDWDWLTPAMVIDYFEQSPDLRPHAADVREALRYLVTPAEKQAAKAEVQADALATDLARIRERCTLGDLIDEEGQPAWGAQTRIAEALGISNAGASNRRRIKAVLYKLLKDEAEAA